MFGGTGCSQQEDRNLSVVSRDESDLRALVRSDRDRDRRELGVVLRSLNPPARDHHARNVSL